jgi:hypothetical protein
VVLILGMTLNCPPSSRCPREMFFVSFGHVLWRIFLEGCASL